MDFDEDASLMNRLAKLLLSQPMCRWLNRPFVSALVPTQQLDRSAEFKVTSSPFLPDLVGILGGASTSSIGFKDATSLRVGFVRRRHHRSTSGVLAGLAGKLPSVSHGGFSTTG